MFGIGLPGALSDRRLAPTTHLRLRKSAPRVSDAASKSQCLASIRTTEATRQWPAQQPASASESRPARPSESTAHRPRSDDPSASESSAETPDCVLNESPWRERDVISRYRVFPQLDSSPARELGPAVGVPTAGLGGAGCSHSRGLTRVQLWEHFFFSFEVARCSHSWGTRSSRTVIYHVAFLHHFLFGRVPQVDSNKRLSLSSQASAERPAHAHGDREHQHELPTRAESLNLGRRYGRDWTTGWLASPRQRFSTLSHAYPVKDGSLCVVTECPSSNSQAKGECAQVRKMLRGARNSVAALVLLLAFATVADAAKNRGCLQESQVRQ
jgi:hypothetical protein